MGKTNFGGKVLVLGCGAVSQCTLPLLFKLIDIAPDRVSLLDFVDNRERISDEIKAGVHYILERITPENYASVLAAQLAAGDLLIDLSWNIDSLVMLEWCRDHGVHYLNTSLEVWDPFSETKRVDPRRYTLYSRQMRLLEMIHRWGENNGSSAVIDHGANPGLVSHFTKKALIDIASHSCRSEAGTPTGRLLERALADRDFSRMAQHSGVKVIHISERDTQVCDAPKMPDEFVNTWSVAGLYEEAVAPAELGWGTHEETLPVDAWCYEQGPNNQVCLSSMGMNTWARSWVPHSEIIGMIIRHGEAFGISDRLTVWEGARAVYRPTVHYVYCPSDSALASLHELRMRRYNLQPQVRILNEEIKAGEDRLGVLLMGHALKSWWAGSLLEIGESRKLIPGQNATTLQVAVAVLAGACWMIKHPRAGVRLPDDLDHEEILETAAPYLGTVISEAVDWSPSLTDNWSVDIPGAPRQKPSDCWQFSAFRAY